MKNMPDIASVMTPMPHTVESSTFLGVAVRIMYAENIRHLPVTEGGLVSGILSDRDAKLAKAVTKDSKEAAELTVGDVCVSDAYVVSPDDKLDTVIEHMQRNHIGSAVVARKGKPVGIFTTTDVCREMAELLKHHYPDS